MPSLGAVKRNTAEHTLRFETDDPEQPVLLRVTYRPGAITPGAIRKVLDTSNPTDQIQGLADLVCAYVAAWDLTEDDGVTPVPVTRERIEGFGVDILNEFVTQLAGAQGPNAGSGTGSPATSPGSLV